jgi:hypothetical protein
MKVIIDRQKVQRRARLSHIASLGGLLVLLGSVAVSLWQPSWTLITGSLLFIGGTTSMVGIYFANRWVKKPRPEEVLDQTLKGLDDRHRLYHYALPCDHLLLTPGGIVVLETVNLEGVFTFRDGRWRQKMSLSRAMRFFVEEKLGDQIERALSCAQTVKSQLVEAVPEARALEARGVVVFTNPYAELVVEGAPIPVCEAKKLRSKLPKIGTKLPTEVYKQIQDRLDQLAGLSPQSYRQGGG